MVALSMGLAEKGIKVAREKGSGQQSAFIVPVEHLVLAQSHRMP